MSMSSKREAAEPVITLAQLTEQLRKFEGQVITNAAGLALVIWNGVKDDA